MGINNPTGGSGNLVLISDINLDAGAAASIDFQNIPHYDEYVLFFQGNTVDNTQDIIMKINNDGGANYMNVFMTQANTTLAGIQDASDTKAVIARATDSSAVVWCPIVIHINNRRADQSKSWVFQFEQYANKQAIGGGTWSNQAALISRITLTVGNSGNFKQYTDCKLYGVL